jgi:hypothetical protein
LHINTEQEKIVTSKNGAKGVVCHVPGTSDEQSLIRPIFSPY